MPLNALETPSSFRESRLQVAGKPALHRNALTLTFSRPSVGNSWAVFAHKDLYTIICDSRMKSLERWKTFKRD